MGYESPTLNFIGGIVNLSGNVINDMDSHFWKGFWFLGSLGIIGGIVLFIGLIVFLLWKFMFKGGEDISDRQMDKEIDEYTRKYSK